MHKVRNVFFIFCIETITLFLFFDSLSGYCDALVFKNLTDADIAIIEKFMRERALEEAAITLSKSLDENCDALVDDEQLNAVFGEKHAKCPDRFEFSPGEKKLLETLAKHVKDLVDGNGENSGLSLFNEKKKRTTKKTVRNRNFSHNCAQASTPIKERDNKSTKMLLQKLLNCLISYGVDVKEWTEHSVSIKSDEPYGNIKCNFCDDNQKQLRVFYREGKRTGYWIVSNFEKHLKTKHKLVKVVKPDNDMIVDSEQQSIEEYNNTCDDDAREGPLNSIHSIQVLEDTTVPSIDETDESLVCLGVVSNDMSMQMNNNTDSWLYKQMSQQIQEMLAANVINSEPQKLMEFELKGQSARSIFVVGISVMGVVSSVLLRTKLKST